MTAAEALASCLARGTWGRAECEQAIADQSVNGVYCDGTIVIEASGKRCVPRELADRVKEARQASPLPVDVPAPATDAWTRARWGWIAFGVVAAATIAAAVVIDSRRSRRKGR